MKQKCYILFFCLCTFSGWAQLRYQVKLGPGAGTAVLNNGVLPYGIDVHDRSNTVGVSFMGSYSLIVKNRFYCTLGFLTQAYSFKREAFRENMEKRFPGTFIETDENLDKTNSAFQGNASSNFFITGGLQFSGGNRLRILPYAGMEVLHYNSRDYMFAMRQAGTNQFLMYTIESREKWQPRPAAGIEIKFAQKSAPDSDFFGIRLNASLGSFSARYRIKTEDYQGELKSENIETRFSVWCFNASIFVCIGDVIGKKNQVKE